MASSDRGRLVGKVAIVTGAARGIGACHARLLAAEGAAVLVNDVGARDGATAADVVAEIEADGGSAAPSTASATWDGAAHVVADAVETFGRLDIVINNATVGRVNDLWNLSEDEWDTVHDVNLKGYAAMMRESIPHLARAGGGSIINTSSGSGYGHPAYGAYASAKEGVVGLTRTAAKEVGRFGIRTNAIRPMAVTSQFHEYRREAEPWRALMEATMGVSRAADNADGVRPEMVSPFVVWLCTDAATEVNGCSFAVAGDRVSLLSEPAPVATIRSDGGWTLDALDRIAPEELVPGHRNAWLLDDHPALRRFPDAGH